MLECIFTIDYEIYGNGEGSLKELVLEPAKQLKMIFDQAGAKFVVFVEAAELEKIEAERTDAAIDEVKDQVRAFYEEGYEIALHLHPQWCNARYQNNRWELDYSEYNLCTLKERRITEIVDRSIAYLRKIVGVPDFTPLSFRAGNWLFQPTATAARVLAKRGIKIDSSVFKGGRQHKHNLDYRAAIKNADYWRFGEDVTIPDPAGPLLEIPIYTRMVPIWRMATRKRIGLQHKAATRGQSPRNRFDRLLDLARFRHPLKFDFCRMTPTELVSTIETVSHADQSDRQSYRPIVAIGHTKDLKDFDTIQAFLSYLQSKSIRVTTLEAIERDHNLGNALNRSLASTS